jgi:hypothetical protein
MFAFLSGGMMGLWLYIVPQLTGRRLWSEVLGNICVLLWNAFLGVGIIGLLNAWSQSREYAEMIWIIDVGVMVVLILNMFNLYMTIGNRVEQKLYVSLWYISGTLIWMPMLYFIGNVMWNPPTGALTGINDTIFSISATLKKLKGELDAAKKAGDSVAEEALAKQIRQLDDSRAALVDKRNALSKKVDEGEASYGFTDDAAEAEFRALYDEYARIIEGKPDMAIKTFDEFMDGMVKVAKDARKKLKKGHKRSTPAFVFGPEILQAHKNLMMRGVVRAKTPDEASIWFVVRLQENGHNTRSANQYLDEMESFHMNGKPIVKDVFDIPFRSIESRVRAVGTGKGSYKRIDEILSSQMGELYKRVYGENHVDSLKKRAASDNQSRADAMERQQKALDRQKDLDVEAQHFDTEPSLPPTSKVGFGEGVDDLIVATNQHIEDVVEETRRAADAQGHQWNATDFYGEQIDVKQTPDGRARPVTVRETAPVMPDKAEVRVTKVISGGQQGADDGAIATARGMGLETGGTMPKGYRRQGKWTYKQRKQYAERYNLKEEVDAREGFEPYHYPPRTMRNVDDADVTIAYRLEQSAGTDATIQYAVTGKWPKNGISVPMVTTFNGKKPVLVITEADRARGSAFVEQKVNDFLRRTGAQTINVAGHREDSVKGITEFVGKSLRGGIRPRSSTATPIMSKSLGDQGRSIVKQVVDALKQPNLSMEEMRGLRGMVNLIREYADHFPGDIIDELSKALDDIPYRARREIDVAAPKDATPPKEPKVIEYSKTDVKFENGRAVISKKKTKESVSAPEPARSYDGVVPNPNGKTLDEHILDVRSQIDELQDDIMQQHMGRAKAFAEEQKAAAKAGKPVPQSMPSSPKLLQKERTLRELRDYYTKLEAEADSPPGTLPTLDLKSSDGQLIGASRRPHPDNPNQRVTYFNPYRMRELYGQKAWSNPRTLRDGSVVEALPADTFATYDEFVEFTLLHEKAHDTILREPDEALGAYETRVNQEAMRQWKGDQPAPRPAEEAPHPADVVEDAQPDRLKEYDEAIAEAKAERHGHVQVAEVNDMAIKGLDKEIDDLTAAIDGGEAGKPMNVYWGTRENKEFSNLAPRPFEYQGRPYESVEHAFQSNRGGVFNQKVYDNPRWKGGGAKVQNPEMRGHRPPEDLDLMDELIIQSMRENPDVASRLLKTAGRPITHTQGGNYWAKAFSDSLSRVRTRLLKEKRAQLDAQRAMRINDKLFAESEVPKVEAKIRNLELRKGVEEAKVPRVEEAASDPGELNRALARAEDGVQPEDAPIMDEPPPPGDELFARAMDGDETAFDEFSAMDPPPPVADPPVPEEVIHETAAVIASDAGISETEWLTRRLKSNKNQLKNPKLDKAYAKALKEENLRIGRALRNIASEKRGGVYKTPPRRWKDAERGAEQMADEVKGYQPPRTIAYYADDAAGMDTETGRSIFRALRNYKIRRNLARKGQPYRPTGLERMAHFRPELWDRVNRDVGEAIAAVQGRRTSSVGMRPIQPEQPARKLLQTRGDPEHIENIKVKALRKVQDDLGIPRAEQIGVQEYDRIRTLLEPHLGRRRRGLELLKKAKDKADFLTRRGEWADHNAKEHVGWMLRKHPHLTPEDAAELVKHQWFDDGILRSDIVEITEYDEFVLGQMFEHLTGANIKDDVAVTDALGANGTLPPMDDKALFRERMLEVGAWSPRATEAAVSKGAWSMDAEAKWWMDNFNQLPVWLSDPRLQPGGEAFKSLKEYHKVMVEVGQYNEAARIERMLSDDPDVPVKVLAHGREADEAAGIHEILPRKDWDAQRLYMAERYGDRVVQGGKFIEAPWLMKPDELAAWMSKNPEYIEDILGDAAAIPDIQRAIANVTKKHFDKYMAHFDGSRPITPGEIHEITFDIVRELSISKPWRRSVGGMFKLFTSPRNYLHAWTYFWTTIVTSNPAFTVLNVTDPIIRGGWFRVTRKTARQGRGASSAVRARADEFFSLEAIGIGPETAFFYGPDSRSVLQRLGRESYGNLDRAGGIWQLMTRSLPKTVLPAAERVAKEGLARDMWMGYWMRDDLVKRLRGKGLSDDAIDRIFGKMVADDIDKMFPTLARAGEAEKLLNSIFPFVSYYAKNQIVWISEMLDHPWMIYLMHEAQDALIAYNIQEWEKRHPDGEAMPEHLTHQIRIPGTEIYIDIGVFTDAARGAQVVAGGANIETLGDAFNRIFRPLPVQQATFDYAAFRLFGHGSRYKYIPTYDENGMLIYDENGDIVYEQQVVPPMTPWGAESFDPIRDLIWTADFVGSVQEAGLDPVQQLQVFGDLLTFNAFSVPSRYYMSNQKYFALLEQDEDAAREWLKTEEGQWLQQRWRESEDPSTYYKISPWALGDGLMTRKEMRTRWLKNQSPEFKERIFGAWDELDIMHDEWDQIMDRAQYMSEERRNHLWNVRNAAFLAFYKQNPHLWYYKGMGMTQPEIDDFLAGYQTDLEMATFYEAYGWNKAPKGKKARLKWEKEREEWVASHPLVQKELNTLDSDYKRNQALNRKAISLALKNSEYLDDLRDAAYGTDAEKRNLRLIEKMSDYTSRAFDADTMQLDPNQKGGLKFRADKLTRGVRAAVSEKAKKGALYAERMEAIADKARDSKGNFDYFKWLKMVDRHDDLKEQYFKKNPKEKADWDAKILQAEFNKKFTSAIEVGNWDKAWDIFANMKPKLRDYFQRKDPKRFARLSASYAYSNAMGRWVRMFDTHGADAAMKYFDSLPDWMKQRYYSNNPGKSMTSGEGSVYVQSLNKMFNMIDKGDWDGAESYWNSLPSWMRNRYYQSNPDSTLFKGGSGGSSGSGGSGGGWSDAKYKKYIKYMNKWSNLQKDGKPGEAKKYYESLPAWVRETHEKKHKDTVQLKNDMKFRGMMQDYMSADPEEQAAMLKNNPGLAQWLNSLDSDMAWRNSVYYIYSTIEDPWLKRIYREKYPEIFSKEAKGEAYKQRVMDTLDEHPEFAKPWLKWYESIANSLEEAMKYSVSRPKQLLPDHEYYRHSGHQTGMSADEVRKRTRNYARQAWDVKKRLPNLEKAIR